MMTTQEKLTSLRTLMAAQGLAAYIILPTDPHQSEYIPTHWATRQWFSGFTGSAGVVVVTADFAGLWTDSRYFIQAEQELAESGIELVKLKIPHTPEYIDWLKASLPAGSVVGVDARVCSEQLAALLSRSLGAAGMRMDFQHDLPGQIWTDRPPMSMLPVYEHTLAFAGRSHQQKIAELRELMQQEGVQYHLFTALDDIAWLFNLRGSDVEYNPVFIAYALIGRDQVQLFVEPEKLSAELRGQLEKQGVELLSYAGIEQALKGLPAGQNLLYTSAKTSQHLVGCIPAAVVKVDALSMVARMKACKDQTEAEHIRWAMVKDGVALVQFFRWLENTLGKAPVTELTLDEQVTTLRKRQPGYVCNSFGTIAGYRDHGAIIHYSATPQSAYALKAEGLLLFDSGAQYLDGTTDITRTVSLGHATEAEVNDYTLVLKGLVELSMAIFPEGTKGFHLDILARRALWRHGKNYGHGTGHGVGYFLNVHEGPQGITPNPAVNYVLQPGMIQSNEPGFYREGAYGIRLENLIMVVPHEETPFGRFLKFETLTLFPFDKKLIDKDLLGEDEISWIDAYHRKVFENLSPYLSQEDNQWLLERTSPL